MDNIIYECNNFMKESGLPYAFCGGYALELFAGTKYRSHSDVDITLFGEDKLNIIDYILSRGWGIYEHLLDKQCLRRITSTAGKSVLNLSYIWSVKPESSLVRIKPSLLEEDCYDFEILHREQKEFDFIEIIINARKNGEFICDKEKNIGRKLDKAILWYENIPYLAPEIILFLISNPAYLESEYHREKTNIDFSTIPKLLSKDSMNWLMSAIKKTYSEENIRLKQLKALDINTATS